jgi:hypothetical protein
VRFLIAFTLYVLQVTLSSIAVLFLHIIHDAHPRATMRLANAIIANPYALALTFLGITGSPIFLRFAGYHCRLRCIDSTTNELETNRPGQIERTHPTQEPKSIEVSDISINSSISSSHNLQKNTDDSSSSVQDLPYQHSFRLSDFSTRGKGGWQNWHNVCCSDVTPSRLADMTARLTTKDFVLTHVDLNRYSAVFPNSCASSHSETASNLVQHHGSDKTTTSAETTALAPSLAAGELGKQGLGNDNDDDDDLLYSPSSARSKSQQTASSTSLHKQPSDLFLQLTPKSRLNSGEESKDIDSDPLNSSRTFYLSNDEMSI